METYKKKELRYGVDKYYPFLKKNFYQCKPSFYGVLSSEIIILLDGTIAYKCMLTATIDNPNIGIMAKCVINNLDIYNWQDKFWTSPENFLKYPSSPTPDLLIVYEI